MLKEKLCACFRLTNLMNIHENAVQLISLVCLFLCSCNWFGCSLHCVSDTKNSVGLVGLIEEISHNAIAVYWNPLESSAKVIFLISLHLMLNLQQYFNYNDGAHYIHECFDADNHFCINMSQTVYCFDGFSSLKPLDMHL